MKGYFPHFWDEHESIMLATRINHEMSEREERSLIRELRHFLSDDNSWKNIKERVSGFENGKVSRMDHYSFLRSLWKKTPIWGLSKKYRNLMMKIDQVILMEQIDGLKLNQEIDEIERRCRNMLYRDVEGSDRELDSFLAVLEILIGYLSMTLTPGKEKEAIKLIQKNADHVAFGKEVVNFIRTQAVLHRIRIVQSLKEAKKNNPNESFIILPVQSAKFGEGLKPYLEYTKLVGRRSGILINNCLEGMKQHAENGVVLIVGTFHINAICRCLRQDEVSYLAIVPEWKASDDGDFLEAVLHPRFTT